MTGAILWATRAIVLSATFVDEENDTTVELSIVGTIPNRTPLAQAGVDRVVQCEGRDGAAVALSGVGSFDPDDPQGQQSQLQYYWLQADANAEIGLPAAGRDVVYQQDIGVRSYDLTVRDATGSATTDAVTIAVEDSVDPVGNAANLPLCIPNDGRLRRFRPRVYASAFTDSCDPSLEYEVVSVVSDQRDRRVRTPDIRTRRADTGRFCVRGEIEPGSRSSRRYTVTVRATDDSGNSSLLTFPVIVPRGACPGGTWSVPWVPDSNRSC